jgi:hypothetical protein
MEFCCILPAICATKAENGLERSTQRITRRRSDFLLADSCQSQGRWTEPCRLQDCRVSDHENRRQSEYIFLSLPFELLVPCSRVTLTHKKRTVCRVKLSAWTTGEQQKQSPRCFICRLLMAMHLQIQNKPQTPSSRSIIVQQ